MALPNTLSTGPVARIGSPRPVNVNVHQTKASACPIEGSRFLMKPHLS